MMLLAFFAAIFAPSTLCATNQSADIKSIGNVILSAPIELHSALDNLEPCIIGPLALEQQVQEVLSDFTLLEDDSYLSLAVLYKLNERGLLKKKILKFLKQSDIWSVHSNAVMVHARGMRDDNMRSLIDKLTPLRQEEYPGTIYFADHICDDVCFFRDAEMRLRFPSISAKSMMVRFLEMYPNRTLYPFLSMKRTCLWTFCLSARCVMYSLIRSMFAGSASMTSPTPSLLPNPWS